MKLVGLKRYFTSCSNLCDFAVAFGCILMFTLYFSSKKLIVVEEIVEDVLLFIWCFWQILRIGMFIKNQQKAKKKVNRMIDLANID